jgi:DNA-binding transcriptional MocR family regulator
VTAWYSNAANRPEVRYLALVEALQSAIDDGRLVGGERLASHRQVAHAIGVSLGTVTRAYAEARRRGLVAGEVGRGMFVRHRREQGAGFGKLRDDSAQRIDLGSNVPLVLGEVESLAWSDALATLRRRSDLAEVLSSDWFRVATRHRRAGCRWIKRLGLDAHHDQVEVVHGVQAALCVALSALTKPGARVLTTCMTHPGLKALAEQLSFDLYGVAMDRAGILPDALEEACAEHDPVALYLEPTAQSPLAITMPARRRRRVSEILRARGVHLIEDENSAFLRPDPPPAMACGLPDLTFLIADASRALSLGVRTTYLYTPREWGPRVANAVSATQWMPVSIPVEVATLWMSNGTDERLRQARRSELDRRHKLARRILKGAECSSTAYAHHLWVELPSGQRSSDFCSTVRRAGVEVEGSDWFAVPGQTVPAGFRIALGAERELAALTDGLERVAQCLREVEA